MKDPAVLWRIEVVVKNLTSPLNPMKHTLLTVALAGLIAQLSDPSQLLGADLNVGLVAYYPFNGNAHDESGHGHDGRVDGAVSAPDVTGPSAGAFRFDGVSDRIWITNHTDFEFTRNFTLAAWVKRDQAGRVMGDPIISKDDLQGTGRSEFLFRFESYLNSGADQLGFWWWNSGWHGGNVGPEVRDTLWHHVAAVHNGGEVLLFLDGDQIGSLPVTVPLRAQNEPLLIGQGHGTPPNGTYFMGSIDDVRIYSRSLAPMEVRDLYSIKAGVRDPFGGPEIDPANWVVGGALRGVTAAGNAWQWSASQHDGYLHTRVWGPTSGNSYGSEVAVRTRHDYNDGFNHVIDFTWGAEVNAYHLDQFAIQIWNGVPYTESNGQWFNDDTEGMKNLYLANGALTPDPVGVGLVDTPPTHWSILIDAPARQATLFSAANLAGNVIGRKSLSAGEPWFVNFIQADATSAGFPAGDNSVFLYDYSSRVEPPLRVSVQVSQVEICWNSRLNRNYQVEYRSSPATGDWLPLGAPVTGTGLTICVTDSTRPDAQRVYRVHELP